MAALEAARGTKDGLLLLAIQELKLIIIGVSLAVVCVLLLSLLRVLSGNWLLAIPFALLVALVLFLAMFSLQQAAKLGRVVKLAQTVQPK